MADEKNIGILNILVSVLLYLSLFCTLIMGITLLFYLLFLFKYFHEIKYNFIILILHAVICFTFNFMAMIKW